MPSSVVYPGFESALTTEARPEHTTRGPAKLTQLEPISLEADRAALWSASEAAIGEKWEL